MSNPFAELINPPMGGESWRWGIVVAASPLRVKLDGDSEPLLATPDSLTPCTVGDRVRCHVYHRRVTVMGVASSGARWRFVDVPISRSWDGWIGVWTDGQMCHLVGAPQWSEATTKNKEYTVATLPVEIRPLWTQRVPINAGGGYPGQLTIHADGRIVVYTYTAHSVGQSISLAGSWATHQ